MTLDREVSPTLMASIFTATAGMRKKTETITTIFMNPSKSEIRKVKSSLKNKAASTNS